MSYQDALAAILAALSLPKTQGWATLEQLMEAAEKLDGLSS